MSFGFHVRLRLIAGAALSTAVLAEWTPPTGLSAGPADAKTMVWSDLASDDEMEGVALLQAGVDRRTLGVPLTTDAAAAVGSDILPLAASVWSVISVSVMYFVIYVLLAVVHVFNQAQERGPGPLERALESAVMGVCFAPMLCTLFFAVNKRADNLTKGSPAHYDLPPRYVRETMPLCVLAFGVQMVLYIIKEWHINRGVDRQRMASAFWNTIFNLAMLGMYAGTGVIIYGVVDMKQPETLRQMNGPVPISSGTFCSICLVILYFVVYAALHVARTLDIWHLGRGYSPEVLQDPFRYVIEVLKIAATTMSFAPMLAVVMIAVQLTVDTAQEKLPGPVETSMYLCSFVLLVQVALAIVTPFITAAELKVVPGRIDVVDFVTERTKLFLLMSIIRWVCMAALYIGIGVICTYLWRQHDEPSWAVLVTHLSTYFFLVYLVLWGAITVRQLNGGGMTSGIRTLTNAKDTVALCPMLAILFLESWVSARCMTDTNGQHGQPQGFAQDYMFVASYAMLVQIILCLISGLIWTLPKDSKVMRVCPSIVRSGVSAVSFLFYLSMVVVYTSILLVLISLFTLSPESATGVGAWFK